MTENHIPIIRRYITFDSAILDFAHCWNTKHSVGLARDIDGSAHITCQTGQATIIDL